MVWAHPNQRRIDKNDFNQDAGMVEIFLVSSRLLKIQCPSPAMPLTILLPPSSSSPTQGKKKLHFHPDHVLDQNLGCDIPGQIPQKQTYIHAQ